MNSSKFSLFELTSLKNNLISHVDTNIESTDEVSTLENNVLEFIPKKPRIDFENKGLTYSFSFQFDE